MLDYIIEMVTQAGNTGLWIVFVILLACGLGLPVPEDIPIVASGIMVSDATTKYSHAVTVCLLGVLLGDCMIYWAGRIWGEDIFKHRFIAKIIKPQFVHNAQAAFEKYGNKIIFTARFMPGLRTPTFFFVGTIKRPFWLFLMIDGIAALISVPVWVYVGKVFGENIPALEHVIKNMKLGTILIGIFLILLFIFGNALKKRAMRFINKAIS